VLAKNCERSENRKNDLGEKKLTAYKLLDAKIRQSTPITKREETPMP
jgi:hypothetical protein